MTQKSFSLDAWRERVSTAWAALGDTSFSGYSWLNEVFDDFVVVQKGSEFWWVTYTFDDDGTIKFAPLNEWVQVEKETEWVSVAADSSESEPDDDEEIQQAVDAGTTDDPSAAKALDDGRIRACAIRFGSPAEPDLSSQRDFFTAETDFWLDSLGLLAGKAHLPMIYHHAADPGTADAPVVGLWTKAVVDESGVWLEGQLDRARKYSGWVEKLIEKGVLRVSSDSSEHLVRREGQLNGSHKIVQWPLLAASLTPTPCEPRLLPVELIGQAYKAVGVSDFDEQLFSLEINSMNQAIVDKIADAVAAKMLPTPPAEPKPDDASVEAITTAVITKLSEMPAVKAAGFLQPQSSSRAEGPFVNRLPHHMDHVKAFDLMLHVGDWNLAPAVKSLLVWNAGKGVDVDGAKAAMNVGTNSQGGYLVPVEYSMEFIKSLAEQSFLRKAGASQIKFPESLTFHVQSLSFGAAAALTSEAASFDEVEPTFGDITFTAYKATRLAKVSDELVDDSRFDIWTEVLQPDWEQAFAAFENTYFTTGSGSSQPQGVITGAGTGKTTAHATVITADEIKDLFYSLNHLYRERPTCAFMMNDAILQYIDKLKDGEGRYLLSGDLSRGMPLQLMGKPIILNNSMASTVATGNKTILFGDFSFFKIADRSSKQDGKMAGTEIYVRRLNELYAASGQVGFRAFMRADSHVMLSAAFKLLVQA